jgi:hypothetical protein
LDPGWFSGDSQMGPFCGVHEYWGNFYPVGRRRGRVEERIDGVAVHITCIYSYLQHMQRCQISRSFACAPTQPPSGVDAWYGGTLVKLRLGGNDKRATVMSGEGQSNHEEARDWSPGGREGSPTRWQLCRSGVGRITKVRVGIELRLWQGCAPAAAKIPPSRGAARDNRSARSFTPNTASQFLIQLPNTPKNASRR